MSDTQGNTKTLKILMALTVAAGLFDSVLFTEASQLINLPSNWIYAVYPYIGWVSVLIGVIALYVLAQHFRQGVFQRKLKRVTQYPHVFWMVWSHWYPDTKVMS